MSNYIKLEVQQITQETSDSVVLILKALNDELIEFSAGQFITIFFKEGEKEIKRAFSIASTPKELPLLSLAIKYKHEGYTFNNLLKNLSPGDIIKALPPLGNFTLNRLSEKTESIVFIGAGSGIAPLYSNINEALNSNKKYKVLLVYGNSTEDDIIFKNSLNELASAHPDDFYYYNVISKSKGASTNLTGRITPEILEHILKEQDTIITDSEYFICGPEGLMNSSIEFLKNKGVNEQRLHKEKYVVKVTKNESGFEKKPRSVTIYIGGKKNEFIVQPNETIMHAAEKQGLNLPCMCKKGECGSCHAKLLSGIINLHPHENIELVELPDEQCVTCVGFPASDDVVIFYDDE